MFVLLVFLFVWLSDGFSNNIFTDIFNYQFRKIHYNNFDSVDKVMTCKINKNSIARIFLLLRNCLLVNK